ncbi:neuropeptide Y receptor type 4-2 [Dromiciops gliroides]|uniref:neuropeptide Y receptor type 4-2 n=1 Tax=Dromiciops gliroides TaxID=33562 RepID=UPI001CC39CA6|nr:neuropeptide Y receptor type 4-2 [Dromiciops gliroides]
MNSTTFSNLLAALPQGQNSTWRKGILSNFSDHCQNSIDMNTFLVIAYSLETFIGILGNLCLVGVVIRQKEKANVTNILIANLAFSDFIMSLFCQPFTLIYTIMDYWIFGDAMCKLSAFIQCMSVTVSVLSLVLIALERYHMITNPLGYMPNMVQAYLGIVVTWLIACFLAMPFMANTILRNVFEMNQSKAMDFLVDKAVCTESWPTAQHKSIYTILLLFLQYFAPLTFIIVCYLRIHRRLKRRRDLFKKNEHSLGVMQMKRINSVLFSMVAAFAICWLPLHVFNGLEDWYHEAIPICYGNLIFLVCHLVAMASTCINPIIYGFLNSNFKKEMKSLFLICQSKPSKEIYEQLPLSTVQSEISKDSLKLSSEPNPV